MSLLASSAPMGNWGRNHYLFCYLLQFGSAMFSTILDFELLNFSMFPHVLWRLFLLSTFDVARFIVPVMALITAPNKSIPPAMVGSWRRFFFSGLLGLFMEGVFQKRLFLLCQNATGESRSGLPFFFSAGDSARGGPFRCRSDSRWTVASRRGAGFKLANTNSSAPESWA